MRAIRPINVINEQGFPSVFKTSVYQALIEILKLAGVLDRVRIQDFGFWRQKDYLQNGQLVKYASVDWYLHKAKESSTRRDQLNASQILDCFVSEPWQKVEPHYDLMLLSSDIYCEDCNFVVGLAQYFHSTVVSSARFQGLSLVLSSECVKTAVFHEVGHVFGLPGRNRKKINQSLGDHCVNTCVMRQGRLVPTDWIQMTHDRLNMGQPYCPECLSDLRSFFRQ